MKKRLALLLLTMILSLSAVGLAAPGDAVFFSEEERGEQELPSPYAVGVGDTLYIMMEEFFYRLKVGDSAPTLLTDQFPSWRYTYEKLSAEGLYDGSNTPFYVERLLSDGKNVYGIHLETGKIALITVDGDTVTVGEPKQLDWSTMTVENEWGPSVRWPMAIDMTDGKLAMLVNNDDDYNSPFFIVYDIASGSAQQWNVPNCSTLVAYQEDTYLMLYYDYSVYESGNFSGRVYPEMLVFDTRTGTYESKGKLSVDYISNAAYDPAGDTFYYTYAGQVFAMTAFGEPALVAYLPMDVYSEGNPIVLDGKMLAFAGWSGVVVANVDPQYLPSRVLNVYGYAENNQVNAFKDKYPDVPVLFNTKEANRESYGMDSLAQAMLAGTSDYDVYQVSVQYENYENMRNKGFCADLSGNASLMEKIQKMYPFLTDKLLKEGKLYGMPRYYMGNTGLSYYPEMWEAAGLSEDMLPKSMVGFLEFIRDWSLGLMYDYEGYALMEGVITHKETLLNFMISQYTSYCEGTGQELKFDTPLFHKLMDTLEQIDFVAIDPQVNPATGEFDDWESLYNQKCLFNIYTSPFSLTGGDYVTSLLVPVDEGLELKLDAYLEVFFVNPKSENMDLAVAYIESYYETMDAGQKIMMFPDENEPVLVPNFDKVVAGWQEEVDWLKEDMQNADASDKRFYEDRIKEMEAKLANLDEHKWLYSEEKIARFRGLVQYGFISGENVLNYSNEDGNSHIWLLMTRYTEGNIGKDQFIREVDRVVGMIRMERGLQ